MRKRARIGLALCLAVILCSLAVWTLFLHGRANRSLSVPELLALLRYEDSPSRKKMQSWLSDFSDHLPQSWELPSVAVASERHERALAGLAALGSAAQPAIPQIVSWITASNYVSVNPISDKYFEGLTAIGPTAIPALRHFLTNESVDLRMAAIYSLISLNPDEETVAVLVELLKDEDTGVRCTAILYFANHQDAIALPLLVENLRDPVQRVRVTTVMCLSRYGPKAVAVLPAVQKALEDPDVHVRAAATNALQANNSLSNVQSRTNGDSSSGRRHFHLQ